MMRHLFCAVIIAGTTAGFAAAQQPGGQKGTPPPLRGRIIKVDANTVYFQAYNPVTKKFVETRQYRVVDDGFRVWRMGEDNKRLPVTGGLKADIFRDIGKEGRFAIMRLRDGRLVEVQITNEAGIRNPLPGTPPNRQGG